jgi:hypothetical protein
MSSSAAGRFWSRLLETEGSYRHQPISFLERATIVRSIRSFASRIRLHPSGSYRGGVVQKGKEIGIVTETGTAIPSMVAGVKRI